MTTGPVAASEARPYTLVAELSYRCPLRCVYCSNPVALERPGRELDTATWQRVLREAEALGVVQVHFTGGEPLLRDDLEALVQTAAECQLYSNLITSGLPLERARLAALAAAGLAAVQISFQDVNAAEAELIAGSDAFAAKRAAAAWTKELGLPLTVNVVLHRQNIGRVAEIIAFAEQLGADRLELANTQYLGWALINRDRLLPGRAALDAAAAVSAAAAQRLRGRMEVLFVLPDYHRDRPRACMDGWGRRTLVVAPDGLMLPCHAAHTIAGLAFPSVCDQPLAEGWLHAPAFQAFRGEAWMQEPCRSCDQRRVDHGGCRCQAFHLTGDAAATDPACALSPRHQVIEAARLRAEQPASASLVYRRVPVVAG